MDEREKLRQFRELDDAFAEAVGIGEGGMEALRDLIRNNLQREVERAQQSQLKEQVTEALARDNTIDLPKSLIDGEIEALQQQMRQRLTSQSGQDASDINLPGEIFEDQARRRVTLGLVMNKLIADNGIKVDQERVRERLREMAAQHQNPQEMIQQYANNREMMQSLEINVLEDQVVDWVVEQAQVEDRPTDVDSLLNPQQTEAGETADTEETSKEG